MWDIIGYIAFGLFVVALVATYVIGRISAIVDKKEALYRERGKRAFVRRLDRMALKTAQWTACIVMFITALWIVNLFGVESEGFGWTLTGYVVIGFWVLTVVVLLIAQCQAGWQKETEEQRKKREERAYRKWSDKNYRRAKRREWCATHDMFGNKL